MWAWSLPSIWKKLPKSQRLSAKCSVIQRGMSHAEPVNHLVFQMLQFYLHLVLFYMCTFSPRLFPSPSSSFPNQKHPLKNPLLLSLACPACCGRRWWQQRARRLCSDSVLLLGGLLPTGSNGHACIRGGPLHLQRCTLGLQNGRPLCKSPRALAGAMHSQSGTGLAKKRRQSLKSTTQEPQHTSGAQMGETQNDRRSGALCVDLSPSPHRTEWFCDCCTCLPLRLGRQDRFPFFWQGEGFFWKLPNGLGNHSCRSSMARISWR